jgi:hypothetical protein
MSVDATEVRQRKLQRWSSASARAYQHVCNVHMPAGDLWGNISKGISIFGCAVFGQHYEMSGMNLNASVCMHLNASVCMNLNVNVCMNLNEC